MVISNCNHINLEGLEISLLRVYQEQVARDDYKKTLKVYNVELSRVESYISQIEQYDLEIEKAKTKYEEFLK